MFLFVSTDPALTRASLQPAGIGKDTAFDIFERVFVYVSEEDVAAFVYCSSPFIESRTERARRDGLHRGNMFCFRPDPNPAVAVLLCEPAHLGFLHEDGDEQAEMTSMPYQQATLNLIANKGQNGFHGRWRGLSCACADCLFDDSSGCTSRGVGYKPASWEPYRVQRSVASQKNQGDQWFISKMVNGLLRGSQGPLEAFAKSMGEFIRKRLHKFRGAKAATDFVIARARSHVWVERWLQIEHAKHGATATAWATATARIFARTRELGWEIPSATNGRSQTWDAYVATVLNINS